MGTENVIELAIEHKIKKVVFLSTDKAVNPINAMGMSKSLMEKLILSKNKASTQLIITRFGNVIASRGSVIPYFIDAVKTGKELTLTNEEMTRFLMSMEQALDLVMFAFEKGNHHDLFVYKCFATKIVDLINAIETILNCKAKIKITGIRPGEKIHEELISSSDYQKAEVVDQSYFLISPNNHKSTNSSSITKNYSSRDNVISIQELIRILFDNEEVKVLIQQDK
jgi:UDP-glucose 4-epimerase